ncbi:hypothetical protein Snas_4279 [Stackebrandtia nassauensis DSM 44728]|uniref:Uncharacterized protein n=1 Tax=Stackebrandtia nassauensis (strain DSM 44728 / CIP 108903 / NRRL B-16338 / NBRC 102104 / LLR-40K-21) TaxID=446470 RepID=D3Q2J5_STANL|nr:hypothetical protein Snas_4279 [Stackebrandtia nassauensis DSM 44728]
MIEGAIRLNRFGLEQGKLWPALLMAVAVFAPVVTWITANHLVPGQEELAPDYEIELSATPPPMAPPDTGSVAFKIPNEGWSIETSESSTKSVTLVHSPLVLTVDAVAGVEDLTVLFNRKKRDLADAKPSYLVTDSKPYRPTDDLKGLRGDLTGERYGGALIVVGKGSVAAVVEVTAPLGRLDGEFDDVDDMLGSLEVTT